MGLAALRLVRYFGVLSSHARGTTMGSKRKPYRTTSVDGFVVLIGRGAEENDVLSLEVAKPDDVWLHVGDGTPGSHVVIQNPDATEIPDVVVERAAELAAWFSKARGTPWVDVHVCRARDVTKSKGAPAGQVRIRNCWGLRVRPKGP
jgi:predicted ribosome quality control (RQC) complex YloA/Tae2 family protein